mmetsp:Transcript_12893/g.16024  ORF Transcript_12893/g.16024 Transcript_12893/m.16024 type:complete len:363 (+) Transcript_12893:239-1327(+)
MKNYMKMHNNPKPNSKYVVISPSGQMCNKMRGIMSAFLIALLSDRILVVKNFLYGGTSYSDLFEDPGFNFQGGGGSGKQKSISMENAEVFACEDFVSEFDAYSTISLNGAHYIPTYIMQNPHYQQRMSELFYENDIARPILAYLFQPKHSLLDRALKQRAELVGIPSADFRKNVPQKDRKHFITYHMRSEFPISPAETKAYRDCARDTTPKHKVNDAAVYVAADSMEFVKRFSNDLSVENGAISQPNFLSTTTFVKGGKKGGLELAFLDLLTASMGDAIFVSAFSSFSRTVILYSQTSSIYLVTDYVMPEQDPHFKVEKLSSPHCYRFYSKEPCAWHGHLKSCSQRLKETSCYTPNMQVQYC